MASAHIEVGTNVRLGAELRTLIDQLQAIEDGLANAKKVYDQVSYGSDWVSLGAALGLTGPSAATDAQTIYNLLGSAVTEQSSAAFTQQLLSRLG